MLKIEIIDKNRIKSDFNLDGAKKNAKKICAVLNYKDQAIAEVFFVTDEEIKKINKKFRKINKVTDVLSFPIDKKIPGKAKILGTIFIAPIFAKAEKISCNKLFNHGLLHLFGFDHKKNLDIWNKIDKSLN
ncbi:MAG: metalloprotein, YbeY family [Candidatus Berkelbacteria bacterium Athens1014_28]|uniref:Endoribonuclease YbeY n=1 Tax=Candidatus Berkelbacteria bacterium Athens1014_28 TaxID=2017145 RepID=A0A554LNA6_9BACT|nr:MAG: metalloprotein, YbeY family [Candidatus Berkelbacteria bacterium Athens1014_28]